MACVVAAKKSGKIIVGHDDWPSVALSDGRLVRGMAFSSGWLTVGFVGSWSDFQTIKFSANNSLPPGSGGDLDWYVHSSVIYHFKSALNNANGLGIGGSMILAVHGEFFTVSSQFDVIRCHSDFVAIGCGREFAVGAMSVASEFCGNAEDIAARGLSAASEFSPDVSGPFHFFNAGVSQ